MPSHDDPAARYHGARDEAARVQLAALEELLDAHDGNRSAVGRELGISSVAVSKRLRELRGGVDPAGAPTREQLEPARRFETPELAADALRDWYLRRQDVDDERDPLLLGAIAAGMEPVEIDALTGCGTTLLRRLRPSGNITVSAVGDTISDLLDEFARLVTNHARDLTEVANDDVARCSARIWSLAAEAIVTNAAPYALEPPSSIRVEDFEDAEAFADAMMAAADETEEAPLRSQDPVAVINGPDAYLSKISAAYRREAARCLVDNRDHIQQAAGQAFAAIADAIRHLRATGTLPDLQGAQAR